MADDKLVEAMARAIEGLNPTWKDAEAEARAALAAIEAAGWRVVPGGDEWRPIDTAPKDGTAIQARIPGHGQDNVIAWTTGLLDSKGNDCGGWHFVEDQEPPDCWTDGICWTVNEHGVASAQPTHWRPLTAPPEGRT